MKINKKYFGKAMFIIISTIISLVLINIFCNRLCVNGLSGLFTTHAYKDAFAETDVGVVNAFRAMAMVIALAYGWISLEANAELFKTDMELEYWKRKEAMENA